VSLRIFPALRANNRVLVDMRFAIVADLPIPRNDQHRKDAQWPQ